MTILDSFHWLEKIVRKFFRSIEFSFILLFFQPFRPCFDYIQQRFLSSLNYSDISCYQLLFNIQFYDFFFYLSNIIIVLKHLQSLTFIKSTWVCISYFIKRCIFIEETAFSYYFIKAEMLYSEDNWLSSSC